MTEVPWQLKPAPGWTSGLRPTSQEGINPKDKIGSLKVPMHLIPVPSLVCQALCMDDGNIKYGPYNFRIEPIQCVGYLAAAKRHIDAYLDGMEYDSLTGKPHLGYALATCGIVIDAWFNGTLIDNRPVKGVGGEMIDIISAIPIGERSPENYRKAFETIQQLGREQANARR